MHIRQCRHRWACLSIPARDMSCMLTGWGLAEGEEEEELTLVRLVGLRLALAPALAPELELELDLVRGLVLARARALDRARELGPAWREATGSACSRYSV